MKLKLITPKTHMLTNFIVSGMFYFLFMCAWFIAMQAGVIKQEFSSFRFYVLLSIVLALILWKGREDFITGLGCVVGITMPFILVVVVYLAKCFIYYEILPLSSKVIYRTFAMSAFSGFVLPVVHYLSSITTKE